MNSMTEMPAPLVFTDSAAEKVRLLIEEEGNAELKLRGYDDTDPSTNTAMWAPPRPCRKPAPTSL